MTEQTDILSAITQICAERNIDPESVYKSLEGAIAVAAAKDYPGFDIVAEIDRTTGEISAYIVKVVVKKIADTNLEITLKEANKLSANAKIGDKIAQELHISSLGRIAANSAKYAILNAIRDAEKLAILDYYSDVVGTIISGKVQRVSRGIVYVELERGTGEVPETEQIPNEYYELGQRYRFLLKELINEEDSKVVLLSRSDPVFVEKLFAMEVPEIANGAVEIKNLVRTAGVKTKVAVVSKQDGIDAIGACVGQKGMRISTIMTELKEERIDVIPWSDDLVTFIDNALRPARIIEVVLDEEKKIAEVEVSSDEISFAVGRNGQNVFLASELTQVTINLHEVLPTVTETEESTKDEKSTDIVNEKTTPKVTKDESPKEPKEPQADVEKGTDDTKNTPTKK